MLRPSLFVGSSSEGLEFARAVRSLLAADAEITLWNEGFFEVGSTFIETLVNELPRYDFAALVLTPDDLVTSRATDRFSPRDNVVFELGLFMGHLGRSRTFMIVQSGANVKVPSDLAGVTTATYTWPRQDGNYRAALGPACDSVRDVVRGLGVAERKVAHQIDTIQDRQLQVESRIEAAESHIARLFAYTMSPSMFDILRKLATGSFGHFWNNGGLARELRHLRDIGYIVSLRRIGDIPDEGPNLSEFITVTQVGEQFVKLRAALERDDGGGR